MTTDAIETESDNQVFLRGRLAEVPVEKVLPSGDVLLSFRLTVLRPPGERVRVDSLECATTRPRIRRSLARAQPGDEVEVVGSLRRRFWRSPAGPASRYAVDATAVRIKRVAQPKTGKSRTGNPKTGNSKTGKSKTAESEAVQPKVVKPKAARVRAPRAGQPVGA